MIFVTDAEKIQTLVQAVKIREEELLHYQINIDNYKLAIQHIADMYPSGATPGELSAGAANAESPDDRKRINAVSFSLQLQHLLIEHELEHDKADMMLKVLMSQLDGVDIKSVVLPE